MSEGISVVCVTGRGWLLISTDCTGSLRHSPTIKTAIPIPIVTHITVDAVCGALYAQRL